MLRWSDEDDSYTPRTVWEGLNSKRKEFMNKVEEIDDLIRLLPVSDECDNCYTPNMCARSNHRHSSYPAYSRRLPPPGSDQELLNKYHLCI